MAEPSDELAQILMAQAPCCGRGRCHCDGFDYAHCKCGERLIVPPESRTDG